LNKYLSSSERDEMLKLGAVESLFMKMEENYSQVKNVDKEMMKYIRTAKTFADKALRIRMKYMDIDEIVKLVEQTRKHRIVVRPRDKVIMEQKEVDKMQEVTVLKTDDFLDFVSWIINFSCVHCTNEGKEVEECGLKRLLIMNDVEVINADADRYCPYSYMEEQAVPKGEKSEKVMKVLASEVKCNEIIQSEPDKGIQGRPA